MKGVSVGFLIYQRDVTMVVGGVPVIDADGGHPHIIRNIRRDAILVANFLRCGCPTVHVSVDSAAGEDYRRYLEGHLKALEGTEDFVIATVDKEDPLVFQVTSATKLPTKPVP